MLVSDSKSLIALLAFFIASFLPQWDTMAQTNEKQNTVIVMGMIHSGHKKSDVYSLERLKSLIKSVEPDYVLTEIPPDRLAKATEQYRETGKITEPRVRVFPEYTDALFPLTRQMAFEIVPCAAWTKEMNESRRATLAKAKKTHAKEYAEMEAAQDMAAKNIATLGDSNDPRVIHTDQFDAFVKAGMEPYDRHFNEMIGDGGWENINAAHYAHIDKALDKHRGEGKRFLITFGSWHKYYIKEQLQKRDDIQLVSMARYLQQGDENSGEQTPSAEQLLAEFSKSWDASKWEKEFRGNQYMRATGEAGWKTRARILKQLVAGGEASVPAIEKRLTDENTATRILAAQAIGYLAPHASIEKLTEVVKNDSDSAVRLYAVDAIGMSGKGKDVGWDALAKNEKNRDVLKHINYAKSRESSGIEASVVSTLVQMPNEAIDSAKVGELAPEFKLKSVDGTEFSLSQYKGKQPVVLLFIYGDT